MRIPRCVPAALMASLVLAALAACEGAGSREITSAEAPPPWSAPPEDPEDPEQWLAQLVPQSYPVAGVVRDPPRWLNGRWIWWTTIDPEGGGWQLHLLDDNTREVRVVYEETGPEGKGIPAVTPVCSGTGDQLALYLWDTTPEGSAWRRVTLETGDWTVTGEEVLPLPGTIVPGQWSCEGLVVDLRPVPEQPEVRGEVVLFPMDAPEKFTRLRDRQGTRYSLTDVVWSPSGEYFLLRSEDACGMARYRSLADLRAYPLREWPERLQYDVFRKDGSFAWSFRTDLVSPGAGGVSRSWFCWMPGDRLFVSDTSRDAEDRPIHTWERVLDSRGRLVWEEDYDGDHRQYREENFSEDEVWYQEEGEEGLRVMVLSFADGERREFGTVAPGQAGGYIDFLAAPGRDSYMVLDRRAPGAWTDIITGL